MPTRVWRIRITSFTSRSDFYVKLEYSLFRSPKDKDPVWNRIVRLSLCDKDFFCQRVCWSKWGAINLKWWCPKRQATKKPLRPRFPYQSFTQRKITIIHTDSQIILPRRHNALFYKMAPNMSLFSVNAILILNAEDGSRIFAKYYTPPHHSSSCSSFPPLFSFNSPYWFSLQHLQLLIPTSSPKKPLKKVSSRKHKNKPPTSSSTTTASCSTRPKATLWCMWWAVWMRTRLCCTMLYWLCGTVYICCLSTSCPLPPSL